ncbi:phage tail protein [Ruegeria meonggei]|uniref:phage tail protein n=1 Tax=Ruegeria meonggei TaxID=1446476 RepID=UPI00366AC12B
MADPYGSFRFRIEADGLDRGGVQSVSGIERTTETEPYREGGVNDHDRQLITKSTQATLILKRGLLDPWFWDWHEDVVNGDVERRTVSIILIDEGGEEAWRWICADAFPSKWGGTELDATASAVAVESIELVHHGLTRQ